MSFLPGMFPALLGSSAFNLTFVGSATTYSSAIDISSISPGSIQAGDLCLIYQWANGSNPIDNTPSGFTELIFEEAVADETSAKISAKKLTGSETTVTGFLGSTYDALIVAVFRPSSTFSSFNLSGSDSDITNSDPASQTIGSGAGSTIPVLAFGFMAGFPEVSPRTISPAMDEIGLTGGVPHMYAHYKIYNIGDTPANHSYDMDDEGDWNTILSGYLTFS